MTIHWCGTGLSSVPGLRRLIEDEREVVVWNRTPERARAAVGDLTDEIRAFTPEALAAATEPGDVVVSMLPADMHARLAAEAVAKYAHFVCSSYLSPELRALDGPARTAGVAVVGEVGLDPGIDHLMAHWLVDDYRNSEAEHPDNEISFLSYCGGIPAEPNTLRYRFSWSPEGVLRALRAPSRSIRDGQLREVARPWEAVEPWVSPLPDRETFEVYPNRDSLPFLEEYGFDPDWKVKEFVRGTLRLEGWKEAWADIFELLEGEVDDARLAEKAAELWSEHAYREGEPDRVVLVVSLKAERDGRVVYHKSWVLDARGDERGSAMARLVSVPVALAVEAVLSGLIPPGVSSAPSDPVIVNDWLDEIRGLAQHMALIDHLDEEDGEDAFENLPV